MRFPTLRLIPIVCLVALWGCKSYEGPFVHKTEEQLDAMEQQNEFAALHFQKQNYAVADSILQSLSTEQTVSLPQYQLEQVSLLLMQGKHQEAHELMMKTRESIETLFDPASEEMAMSYWHGENNKVFKGEPHERATLYALLAMTFMEQQAWEDALRCVKNGLLADASTGDEVYNSDYGLLHYLGYVAARYAGDSATADEYARELQLVLKARNLPSDMPGSTYAKLVDNEIPLPNAFIVVWTGTPPTYLRGGEYDEIRHIVPGDNVYTMVTLETPQTGEVCFPALLADINFQAMTRGGRAMDNILSNKAALKKGLEVSRNIFFIVGYGCLTAAMTNTDAKAALPLLCVGGGCMILGAAQWIIGECINSRADVRAWHNLPGEFLILPLHLPETSTAATLRAYQNWDNFLEKSIQLSGTQGAFAVHHVTLPQTTDKTYKDKTVTITHRQQLTTNLNLLVDKARALMQEENSWMKYELTEP